MFPKLVLLASIASLCSAAPNFRGPTISISHLFPVQQLAKWSTSTASAGPLAISDSTFGSHNILSSLPREVVTAPDGVRSMKAHYPKGSYTFGHDPQGGFSFYGPGPSNVNLTTAKEVTFAYSVYFPSGFDFMKGGKLPGGYGGDSEGGALGCSGGSKRTDCFSIRLMWRSDGQGEFYTYTPPFTIPGFEKNEKECSVPPFSDCNPEYGNSVGRGAFSFKAGTRTIVAERIKLNDVGKANGEIELWVKGKSVIKVTGLVLRAKSSGRIRGLMMQTFFGGNDKSWASPEDQDAYFSDFSVAITQKL